MSRSGIISWINIVNTIYVGEYCNVTLLNGIYPPSIICMSLFRYNPENLATLERYVETQAKENAYDLEANLAVLKL